MAETIKYSFSEIIKYLRWKDFTWQQNKIKDFSDNKPYKIKILYDNAEFSLEVQTQIPCLSFTVKINENLHGPCCCNQNFPWRCGIRINLFMEHICQEFIKQSLRTNFQIVFSLMSPSESPMLFPCVMTWNRAMLIFELILDYAISHAETIQNNKKI